jgi:putative ATP-dependent endonuclease of OLD family
VPEGAIVLIDEIETGLEPHRLRHLIRELRVTERGQVVMTTHSEVPIVELSTAELRVVNSWGGVATVRRVPNELQAAVRAAPEALLGRRLIVCEGKTEVGLCRALDRPWAATHGAPPANVGIVLVPGGGTPAPRIALGFSELGYGTGLLADSDVPLDPPEEELSAGGVAVFTWDGSVSTEERVTLDARQTRDRSLAGSERLGFQRGRRYEAEDWHGGYPAIGGRSH